MLMKAIILVVTLALPCCFCFFYGHSAKIEVLKKIRSPLQMTEAVEMYTRVGCKFCRIAKAKLETIGVPFLSIDIEDETDALSPLTNLRKTFARSSTVPQIYVGDEHVGGCSQLLSEIDDGVFIQRLLRHNVTKVITKHPATPDTPTTVPVASTRTPGTPLNTRAPSDASDADVRDRDMLAFSRALQWSALALTDKFVSEDGLKVDYDQMRASQEFQRYVEFSQQLQSFSMEVLSASLSDQERFSFFANLYNAMIIHANCIIGPPSDNPQARSDFFSGRSGAVYDIGGHLFSPDDIEHGVLRANTAHPSQRPTQSTYFNDGDPRSVLAVSKLDPRVHFILNCGAASCPPIQVLGGDPEEALCAAARAYLQQELRADVGAGVLWLPRLALWYKEDFGSSARARVATLLSLLEPHQARTIRAQLSEMGYDETEAHSASSPYGGGTQTTQPTPAVPVMPASPADGKDNELPFTLEYNAYSWTPNDISAGNIP